MIINLSQLRHNFGPARHVSVVTGETIAVHDNVKWHYEQFVPEQGHTFTADEFVVFKPTGEPCCCLKLIEEQTI